MIQVLQKMNLIFGRSHNDGEVHNLAVVCAFCFLKPPRTCDISE